jgi:hypothetical protein
MIQLPQRLASMSLQQEDRDNESITIVWDVTRTLVLSTTCRPCQWQRVGSWNGGSLEVSSHRNVPRRSRFGFTHHGHAIDVRVMGQTEFSNFVQFRYATLAYEAVTLFQQKCVLRGRAHRADSRTVIFEDEAVTLF